MLLSEPLQLRASLDVTHFLRQGKETKRETLLKQIKDVDELMNEEQTPI